MFHFFQHVNMISHPNSSSKLLYAWILDKKTISNSVLHVFWRFHLFLALPATSDLGCFVGHDIKLPCNSIVPFPACLKCANTNVVDTEIHMTNWIDYIETCKPVSWGLYGLYITCSLCVYIYIYMLYVNIYSKMDRRIETGDSLWVILYNMTIWKD